MKTKHKYHHNLPFYAYKTKKLFIPFTTIIIACIAFPLAINALEVLANPKDQIFKIRANLIASEYGAIISTMIPNKYIILRIPPALCIPTDSQSLKAMQLFHKLCSLNPNVVLQVYEMSPRQIYNGFWDPETKDEGEQFINVHHIPAAKNPMTLAWTSRMLPQISDEYYDNHRTGPR